MYTPFAYAFAYAIKQTPCAFASKIILCMYLLYGTVANYPPWTQTKYFTERLYYKLATILQDNLQ